MPDQQTLFSRGLARAAVISDCGRYRYRLDRVWSRNEKPAVFVMLNPSTADALVDDPTIRRCMGFARARDFGGIVVVNLFAWRATEPAELTARAHEGFDVVGPDNDRHLAEVFADAHTVVAAWGVRGVFLGRDRTVAAMVPASAQLTCLRTTKAGHPEHPLYLPGRLTPQPFEVRHG
jgi:hypothetical protein